MIATLDELKIFLDMAETDDSMNDTLNQYLNAVDTLFNEQCDREFGSTTYTNQEYNGTGGKRLWLRHIPVTAITQISDSREPGIRIKNTTSGAARATIDISTSAQTLTHTLVVGGTTTSASIDLTDAASDTLAELVTVLSALGNGWEAEIWETTLEPLPSTELLEVMGVNVGVPRGGGDAEFEDFDIPGTPLGSDVRIEDREMGIIFSQRGFGGGVNKITVSYTAGYTAALMPNDLKLGVMAGAQALLNRGQEDGFGTNNFSTSVLRISYAKWLPDYTLEMIAKYKRRALG